MNEDINYLIDRYIKEDNKEKIFDLVCSCDDKEIIHKVANYYIKNKDANNLCSLICLTIDYIDLRYIFNKVIETEDKTFMYLISKNGSIRSVIPNSYLSDLDKK